MNPEKLKQLVLKCLREIAVEDTDAPRQSGKPLDCYEVFYFGTSMVTYKYLPSDEGTFGFSMDLYVEPENCPDVYFNIFHDENAATFIVDGLYSREDEFVNIQRFIKVHGEISKFVTQVHTFFVKEGLLPQET